MKRLLSLLLILALLPLPLLAQGAPATGQAPATQPATAPPVDPAARGILDQLEQAGGKYPALTSDLRYEIRDRMTGDTELRTGQVKYRDARDGEPTMFYIRFDTLKQGDGPAMKDLVEYGFDGQYLSIKKHRLKQLTRYQVAVEGQTVNPVRLGQGPFPVPFGQKTEDVLKLFEATTRAPTARDPKNTDYLRLVPLDTQKDNVNFEVLELWVDREAHLPVKARSRDRARKLTTVEFADTRTNVGLARDDFYLKREGGTDWEYHVEKLQDNPNGPKAP